MLFAFLILMIAGCGFAIAKGGRSERAAAIVILLGSIVSPCVAHLGPQLWHGFEAGIFLVDLAMLIAFGVIMLASSRYWPIWTTALQLLTVASHLGPLLRNTSVALPFAFDEELWGYVILVQLLIVTALGTRRTTINNSPPPQTDKPERR